MGKISSYNGGGNSVDFGVNTENFSYAKLGDLYANEGGSETTHELSGIYIHKSQLAEQPIAIQANKKRLVNLPSHLTETVRKFLGDAETVAQIKSGGAAFKIYEYASKQGRKCYSVNFVDK